MNPPTPNRRRPSEEGYILVAVIFMMAILILSLAIAVPRVRESIQRDREEETMQRGKQYVRAVQLYYRKFNAYPPNVDALVKTNNIRFLRKKYVDPTTGKDEWKSIQFGQNKTPQAMGFFGQPLAAANGAGIGPSGGNTGTTTGIGGTSSTTNSGLFNSSPTSSTDSGAGTTGQSGSAGTDANGNPISGTGTTGTTGSSGSAFGSSSNPTGSGQSFGGGGIIGFSPQSPKQSLMIYKKKNHYNEWEFLYSPMMDQQNMVGGNTGAVGQPASGTTTPIGGGTGTTPTAPTTPTTPTTPQQ
ncbi:MAG: type II secretion system protein [Terracidiphilus sp.]